MSWRYLALGHFKLPLSPGGCGGWDPLLLKLDKFQKSFSEVPKMTEPYGVAYGYLRGSRLWFVNAGSPGSLDRL